MHAIAQVVCKTSNYSANMCTIVPGWTSFSFLFDNNSELCAFFRLNWKFSPSVLRVENILACTNFNFNWKLKSIVLV